MQGVRHSQPRQPECSPDWQRLVANQTLIDSDEVSGVIENLDVLKQRFATLMAEEADGYLALAQGQIDDKAVERIIDTFTDKGAREELSKFFKGVETLYEIISPALSSPTTSGRTSSSPPSSASCGPPSP